MGPSKRQKRQSEIGRKKQYEPQTTGSCTAIQFGWHQTQAIRSFRKINNEIIPNPPYWRFLFFFIFLIQLFLSFG